VEADEAQLFSRIAARDRCALLTLYEIYFPCLAAFFTNLSMPIETLINDTWLDVWSDNDVVDSTGSPFVRIMRIAVRRARLYSTRWRPKDVGPAALLANLSIDQRAVMHFVYTGRSREEVCEILGLPRAGIDTLLGQSREALLRYTSAAAQQ
jgi:hypothetical protein